ncbi:unnamed protein product [Spirodela intermedia]|uniref:Uncharacterized protein n=1 Tax=Spirodela intermedia TaxID=51605 RepID=A0A7I8J835_SPIIN|nr:unnamed protein product [Spirodela intermedia]CAA6665593.1 unnamed protein product [Spirodela intermedia]
MADVRDEYGNPIGVTGGHGAGLAPPARADTPPGTMRRWLRADDRSCNALGAPAQARYSEDDGMGGRRKKKGMKEKIMEKMPGHKPEHQQHHEAGYAPQSAAHQEPEKKGIVEKIKEKLPGHHN